MRRNTDTKIVLWLQAALIGARMAGTISWPWVWVLVPAWGFAAFLIIWFIGWYIHYMRN